jgi:arsenite-transporting ATPase
MGGQDIRVFYLGKGGVGKSTLSALCALYFSRRGKKVLLVSMDPAHNQADIFEKELSDKAEKINENLYVIEVNVDKQIQSYLSKVEDHVNSVYRYLTAFNLEKYFDIIKYSPGMEEYALLLAYNDILSQSDANLIVFDMPPTALAIRFFNLPSLSLIWLEKLVQLRQEIVQKRKIITKIKIGKKDIERDKVLNQLNKQIDFYSSIQNIFEDQVQTIVNIVINPDKLSVIESQDIINHLQKIKLRPRHIILNKYSSSANVTHMRKIFKDVSTHHAYQVTYPLVGMKALQKYLTEYPDMFPNMLF